MLKTAFPLAINTDFATFDIQCGSLRRPTHRNTSWDAAKYEVCAQRWADLSEGDCGVSLLNDCKYGHDAQGSVLRLTLLKAGMAPDEKVDRGSIASPTRFTCTRVHAAHRPTVWPPG